MIKTTYDQDTLWSRHLMIKTSYDQDILWSRHLLMIKTWRRRASLTSSRPVRDNLVKDFLHILVHFRTFLYNMCWHSGRASLRPSLVAGSHWYFRSLLICICAPIWSISSYSVIDQKPVWHIPWLSVAPGQRPERKTMSRTNNSKTTAIK